MIFNFRHLAALTIAWLVLLWSAVFTASCVSYDTGWRDGIKHAFVSENPATEEVIYK